ncbi:MAG: hypothetical protein F9K18_04070 [Thermoanaerobaculia bacterium]|nr:MAG: hypothetical protein F9K18_04070 [Thermoanaerobaculia bacterium]
MRAARFAFVAALVAAVAQPVLAGVVYVPAANVTRDGVLRSTQVVLSNQDVANITGIKYRFIEQNVSGSPLPAGPFPILYAVAGGTSIAPVPEANLPAGKTGMLEVFPGTGSMIVGGRLVYSKPGVYVKHVDLPAISSSSTRAANSAIFLQGIEHGATSGVVTDLGVFNLGTSTASCSMDVHSAGGTVIASGVAFSIPAYSSLVYADFFGPTPTTGGIEVPANSWAKITCNSTFYALGVRHNSTNGDTRDILPTDSLAASSLAQPGGAPPQGGAFNFQRPGLFLECTRYNKFWKTSLSDGRVAGQQFRKIVVDFDVYHANWDPQKKTHIYMWLQNGQSWSSLFGYLIASKSAGVMRFQVKFGIDTQVDSGPAGQPGNTYHVHYEWDGVARKVLFTLRTQGGSIRAQKTLNLNRGAFTVGGMFFATGSWPTGEGPEALQYGWKYYNLNVDYFQ